MSYLSLARKYRPRRFEDLVGQESVSLALSNAIKLKRAPSCVIFTGVRGVGKTTTARIYAKALNCEQGPTPAPCEQCSSCLAIQEGTHEDVLEIDGASHTGVDDVRALQETLGYVPQRSHYKIYIIDEVHMLSGSAFNALLKTIEEPPPHVVFIFATTELHKVPETIQSRCPVFHLQKIPTRKIKDRLAVILEKEGIPSEDAVLQWVAREGHGSLRDALTLLDQVIAVSGGQLTWTAIQPMAQSGHAESLSELLEALLQRQGPLVLSAIARWDQEGLAMSTLVELLAKTCRNAFILKTAGDAPMEIELLELEERERIQLARIGADAKTLDLNRLFRLLARCLDDLRNVELDRFVVENYCLEWCLDPGLPDVSSLMRSVQQGQTVKASPMPSASTVVAPSSTPAAAPREMGLKDRWKMATDQPTSAAASTQGTAKASPPPPAAPAPTMERPLTALSMERAVAPAPSMERPLAATSTGEKPAAAPANIPLVAEKSVQPAPANIPPVAEKSVQPAAQNLTQENKTASAESKPTPTQFPDSWRSFVDEWKKQKPLQARVLEETYILEYSAQRIRLAVEAGTMAGQKLMHVDTRKRLLLQFEQLFGFKGIFEVVAKEGGAQKTENLGESLLETKQKEKEVARENLRRRVEDHPLTREVIQAFDGTIEAIDVH